MILSVGNIISFLNKHQPIEKAHGEKSQREHISIQFSPFLSFPKLYLYVVLVQIPGLYSHGIQKRGVFWMWLCFFACLFVRLFVCLVGGWLFVWLVGCLLVRNLWTGFFRHGKCLWVDWLVMKQTLSEATVLFDDQGWMDVFSLPPGKYVANHFH